MSARSWLDSPFWYRGILFFCLSWLLVVPALLWSFVAKIRRKKGYRAVSAQQPFTLCVGNLVLGGSGKSPVVRALARWALSQNKVVCIVTRGIGKTRLQPYVCAGPWFGGGVPQELGDEAREHWELLTQEFPTAKLIVAECRHRQAAIEWLSKKLADVNLTHTSCILLDDGLQHFSAARHANVVVWNLRSVKNAPFWCPPLGSFREGTPFSMAPLVAQFPQRIWSRCAPGAEKSLLRAAQIFLKRTHIAIDPAKEVLAITRKRIVRAQLIDSKWVYSVCDSWKCSAPQALVLVGLAHGKAFATEIETVLKAEGLAEIAHVILPDHGKLPNNLPPVADGSLVVLSAKDFFRWEGLEQFRIYVLNCEVRIAQLDVDLNFISGESACPRFFPC